MNYSERLEIYCKGCLRNAKDANTNDMKVAIMNKCYGALQFAQWNNYISYIEYCKLWKENYLPAFVDLIKKS